MTIDINELAGKLVGKRVDAVDGVVLDDSMEDNPYFVLPRLRLVDPLGDVTYLVLSPQLEASLSPDRHATFAMTATVNFIVTNVNQEEDSDDIPTTN